MVSVPSGANIVWQLEDARKNGWQNYVQDVQAFMTAAAVSGRKVVNLVDGKTEIVADIFNLNQLSNDQQRRIRGLVKSGNDFFSWEVKDGVVWEPISVGHAV